MTEHKTIYAALLAAQSKFKPALKTALNKHFGSKYADLQACLDAVMPALSAEGIVIHWSLRSTDTWVVSCHLYHVASESGISCDWPVIASKQDAQGFASSSTYARRYSLMAVVGIAPEDDDGNAAASTSAPQVAQAEKQASALLSGCIAAIEHGDDEWLAANVLAAPPSVRAVIARSLTAEQKRYLASLKEGD